MINMVVVFTINDASVNYNILQRVAVMHTLPIVTYTLKAIVAVQYATISFCTHEILFYFIITSVY